MVSQSRPLIFSLKKREREKNPKTKKHVILNLSQNFNVWEIQKQTTTKYKQLNQNLPQAPRDFSQYSQHESFEILLRRYVLWEETRKKWQISRFYFYYQLAS